MHHPLERLGANTSRVALLVALSVFLVTVRAQQADMTSYQEAPQLAEQVATGALPPVQERLPDVPLVVPVIERIGDYGGTWRMAMTDDDAPLLGRTIGYEFLMRWSTDGTTVIPNIAESYETNEAGNEFTFYLREGMKWSDGHPFTANDIMFWYEDVLLNETLTPVVPTWLTSAGETVVVEKLDDYTIKFTFGEPNAFFLQDLASIGGEVTAYPRHYLEQFHADYNADVDTLMRQANFEDWLQLFASEASWTDNSSRPVLLAWRFTTAYGESTQRLMAERNPYYWKVDSEGNQLPYIDSVVYDVLQTDVIILRALNGELDFQPQRIATLENKAVFFDNMERGDFRFYDKVPTNMNRAIFALNLTVDDPVKRQVFNNKDFRIGLSHAINRQEIIDLVLLGQSEGWQAAPRPESTLYNEEMAKQYTAYDIDLANEYLDRVLPERDAEGWRLGPDGSRFTFILEISSHNQARLDVAELVGEHIRQVGVDMVVRPIDRTLWTTRVQANEHDAAIDEGQGGIDVMQNPRWYFPQSNGSLFAPRWAAWYTDPESALAEEPTEAVRRQMELYDELRGTVDQDRQAEVMAELLAIAADEFYVIGVALFPLGWGVAKNDFRNVPDSMMDGAVFFTPALTNPEQYFFTTGDGQ